MRRRSPLTSVVICATLLIAGNALLRAAGGSMNHAWQLFRNPFRLTGSAQATGPVILEKIQQLQRLETCRYSGQVVVRGDNKGWLPTWLAGDRMLFVGRGEVVAGVDLARLKPEDVRVEQGAVSLRLPQSEILHSRLDNHTSEVYDRRCGLFSGPDQNLETRVRQEAEDRIRQAALESGVLSTADANARDALRRQMEGLGFKSVRFL